MDDDSIELTPAEREIEHGGAAGEALMKRIAALAVSGTSKAAIAKELKISRRQVDKAYNDERFLKLVDDIGNDAIATTKTFIQKEFSKLSPEILRVLKANLKKDSLEAVKVFLKAMGLDAKAEEDVSGNGNLTVVLATQNNKHEKMS